jgi:hypothetical protein
VKKEMREFLAWVTLEWATQGHKVAKLAQAMGEEHAHHYHLQGAAAKRLHTVWLGQFQAPGI